MPTGTAVLTLVSLALCVPLPAQSQQAFLSPPKLQAATAASAIRPLLATISATGCNPAGDINQVGKVQSGGHLLQLLELSRFYFKGRPSIVSNILLIAWITRSGRSR
jgi:hypothetical protein